MKFDYILGNPPYQGDTVGDQKRFAAPMYNSFMDAAYELSDHVMLITPARFLYNAGATPKAWNEKMLADPHLKVIKHHKDSSTVFPDINIAGGVVITYHDANRNYGAIGTYTPYDELNSILHKVAGGSNFESIFPIVMTSYAYHFTDNLHEDHPEAASLMSKGHAYDLKSNVFSRLESLADVFMDEKPDDGLKYIRVYGLNNGNRVYKYIRAEYVREARNLYKWKVLLPKAYGSGVMSEGMPNVGIGAPVTAEPGTAHTESFISIGFFETKYEAESCRSYIKTKFARAMLGVLKVTQDNPPEKWRYVPLQRFAPPRPGEMDIDWSASIPEIDAQLYRKYGLDGREIDFIETHVKEMN